MVVIRFQTVENLSAYRHNCLKIRLSRLFARTESRVALHDIQFAFFSIAASAIDELFNTVTHVYFARQLLFEFDAAFFRIFTGTLVYEDLFNYFIRFGFVFNKEYFKLMTQKFGHSVLNKLVRYRLFRLVFIRSLCRIGVRYKNKTVRHVLKRYASLVFIVLVILLNIRINTEHKCVSYRLVGRTAVFEIT